MIRSSTLEKDFQDVCSTPDFQIRTREEFGKLFNRLDLLGHGIEIGVQAGHFSKIIREPARIVQAQDQVHAAKLDDAMTLYAQNCSVCHGLTGKGIGPVPPLDSAPLRTMSYDEIYKTIARGRFNTAMPTWNQMDGGPLNDYQVSELAMLVLSGDWNATRDRVVNLGLAPLVPFTTDPDPALLAEVGNLPDGAILQTAIQLFAANCVACHGADGLGSAIAPALNDKAVRAMTADELTRTITLGRPGTLMAGWENARTAEEIAALVTLIRRWDQVPAGVLPAPNAPIPVTADSLARGERLFVRNCARCHGPQGQGKLRKSDGSQRAPALNLKSFLADTTDQAIQQIVTQGVPGTDMLGWGDRMTETDIQAVVGFIRQWEPTAPEIATPIRGGSVIQSLVQQVTSPTPEAIQSLVQNATSPTTRDTWYTFILAFSWLSIACILIWMGIGSLRAHAASHDPS